MVNVDLESELVGRKGGFGGIKEAPSSTSGVKKNDDVSHAAELM